MCPFDVPMISTEHGDMFAEMALATDSPMGEFLWPQLADVEEHQFTFTDSGWSDMITHPTLQSSPNSTFTSIVANNSSASGCVVHNSFIHIAPVPLTPIPGARRRAKSLPTNRSVLDRPPCAPSFTQPTERLSVPSNVPFNSTLQESTRESRRVLFCPDEPLDFAALTSPDELHPSQPCSPAGESNSAVHSPKCIMTPMQVCLVPPTPLCLMPPTPSPTCCSSNGSLCKDKTPQGERRLKFCADEPLDLNLLDAASPVASLGSTMVGTPCYVSPCSPLCSPLPATSPAPWKLVPPTPSPTSLRPPLGRLLGQPLCPPGLETSKGALLQQLSQALQQQSGGCR